MKSEEDTKVITIQIHPEGYMIVLNIIVIHPGVVETPHSKPQELVPDGSRDEMSVNVLYVFKTSLRTRWIHVRTKPSVSQEAHVV